MPVVDPVDQVEDEAGFTCTLYDVAPLTAVQLIVAVVAVTDDAANPVGVPHETPAEDVVNEAMLEKEPFVPEHTACI